MGRRRDGHLHTDGRAASRSAGAWPREEARLERRAAIAIRRRRQRRRLRQRLPRRWRELRILVVWVGGGLHVVWHLLVLEVLLRRRAGRIILRLLGVLRVLCARRRRLQTLRHLVRRQSALAGRRRVLALRRAKPRLHLIHVAGTPTARLLLRGLPWRQLVGTGPLHWPVVGLWLGQIL